MKQASQVVDLLEYFSTSGQPASLAEISRQLGWPKSSAFKLLATLSARGYLYEPYGRGMFYPAPKWGVVVGAIGRSEPTPPALLEFLRKMAAQTGETSVLASISGFNAYFVEAVEPENPVRYTAQIGKTVPLHVSAIGRALIAQLPQAERAAILDKIEYRKHTAASLMTAKDVEQEVVRGIQRGYFEGRGELNEDLGGIALPLSIPGRPLAVMVAGPLYRIRPRYDDIARRMMQQIKAVERQLS